VKGTFVVTAVDAARAQRRSRNLEERLIGRFPWIYQAFAAALWRLLPPRSRLRRALLRRQMVSGYAAGNRRDYELMLVRYAPDLEVEFDPELATLGLGGTFHGHQGLLRVMETFGEAWEDWQLLPSLIVDLGDRAIGLARFHLPGTASGVELEREFAQLVTPRRGLIADEREFLSWEAGLRAAGLDPDSFRGAIAS
jgi:hypothetical protein